MPRKYKKKTKAEKLIETNWQLCREIVKERDGYKCILCGSKEDLQLDHCITRHRKSVFFNLNNLHYLCPKHHQQKSMESGGPTDKAVDLEVILRIGKPEYRQMVQESHKVLPEWKRLWYQEEMNEKLKEQLEYWKIRTE